VEPYFLVWR